MILEIKNISKSFGGVHAISNTTFAVKKKQIYGIIGPNGAGKTTMFNIITGNYKPTNGEVFLDGTNITNLKNYKIVHCGIARTFQSIRLFKTMTVLENLMIGMDHDIKYTYLESIFRLPRFNKEEQKSHQFATEILKNLSLLEFKDQLATSLSYGNQRRVEIARALATQPKILLLDEPAAGMNHSETAQLATLLQKIRDDYDITILLIEHDMKFVNHLCDKVLVLDYGKAIFEGHISDAIKNKDVISAYLGDKKYA
ncbi:MAG: high-affinity branched-chain amino acid ABC transporter ATP-binding protein LivG [Gammaproteobacteria bacterium]|nr:MAG: high-affinity branched-chain amino acid ABC transporter ATP-binding protein LivG [Gammaproteobacteria bacterium]